MNNVPFLCTKLFQKRGHYSRGDIIQGGALFKEIRYVFFKKKLTQTLSAYITWNDAMDAGTARSILLPGVHHHQNSMILLHNEAISFINSHYDFFRDTVSRFFANPTGSFVDKLKIGQPSTVNLQTLAKYS